MANMLRKIKLNIVWNRLGFASILIFLVYTMFMFVRYLEGQSTLQISSVSLSPVKLVIENAPVTKPVFRVYHPINNEKGALLLGQEIVKQLKGLHEYSAVEVTYYLGASDKNMKLQEDFFDLFRSKPGYEKGLPDIKKNIPIVSYDSYGVYFISKDSEPRLDGSYLSGKLFGLLRNPYSESGHSIPKKVIAENVGKKDSPIFKADYASHGDLREGLQKGEVDIISSYWDDARSEKYPGWQRLKIGDVLKGETWYLGSDDDQSDIVCPISEALQNYAKKQSDSYWKKVKDLTKCNEPHE